MIVLLPAVYADYHAHHLLTYSSFRQLRWLFVVLLTHLMAILLNWLHN